MTICAQFVHTHTHTLSRHGRQRDIVRFFIESVAFFVRHKYVDNARNIGRKFLNFISLRSFLFDICACAYFAMLLLLSSFFSTFRPEIQETLYGRSIFRQHSRRFVSKQVALHTMGVCSRKGGKECACVCVYRMNKLVIQSMCEKSLKAWKKIANTQQK